MSLSQKLTTSDYSTTTTDNSYSEVKLQITQPILNGFGSDNQLIEFNKAKLQEKTAFFNKQSQTAKVVYDTTVLFYDTKMAIDAYKVTKKSLQLAKKLLENKNKEVKLNAFAKGYIYEIEANVLQKEIALFNAKKTMEQYLIRLKKETSLDISIKDIYYLKDSGYQINIPKKEYIVSSALSNRYDYIQAKNNYKISLLQLSYEDNQKLPTLDLYGSVYKNDDQSEVYSYSNRSYDEDGYEIGVKFSYPLFNTTASSKYQQSQIEKQKNLLILQEKKKEILQEVESLQNDIYYQKKFIATYKQLVEKEKKSLQTEQKKLDNGLSTVKDLISAQDDFIKSEFEYLRSQVDYKKSIAKVYYTMRLFPVNIKVTQDQNDTF